MLGRLGRLVCACVLVALAPADLSAFSAKDFLEAIENNSSLTSLRQQRSYTTDRKEQRMLDKRIREEERKESKAVREIRALAQKAERNGINTRGKHGRTLLMMATHLSDSAGVEYLLQHNPDLTIRDDSGKTALELDAAGGNGALRTHMEGALRDAAISKDYTKIVEFCKLGVSSDILLTEGPLVGVFLKDGKYDEFVQAFRGKRLGKNPVMADGQRLSDLILQSGRDDVLKLGCELLGNELWESAPGKISPLFYLLSRGHLEGVRMYCHQKGVDTEAVRQTVRFSTPEVVKWMMEQPKAREVSADPTILEAARRGNMAVYEAVVAAGKDPASANSRGETVLMHAALSGNETLVKAVLEKLSAEQVKAVDESGRSAVYYARLASSPAVERMLVAAGVTATDKDKP